MIDLSWVTFMEEFPAIPCTFYECDMEAVYMIEPDSCNHQYPFCVQHTQYTENLMEEVRKWQRSLICTICKADVHYLTTKPITRG